MLDSTSCCERCKENNIVLDVQHPEEVIGIEDGEDGQQNFLMEEENVAVDEEVTMDEEMEEIEEFNKNQCCNCFRYDVDLEGNQIDAISIELRSSIGIRYRLKLCSIQNPGLNEIMLCEDCYIMLTNGEKYYEWKSCWPAFLWKIFSAVDNYELAEEMWRCIPTTLRLMWLQSYVELSQHHRVVTIEEPASYFDDVTIFGNEIDRLKGTGIMTDLVKWGNLNCYCGVRCPWGCTDFVDECGYIPYYKFFYELRGQFHTPIEEKSIRGAGTSTCAKNVFTGIRPDYLSYIDYLGDNQEWPLAPRVRYFPDKGFFICTCGHHNGGSSYEYLHPPINPVTKNYPSTIGDQLAHAVLVPRMLKTIRYHKYNDTYQMQRCYGGFAGVDSCDVSEVGAFHRSNFIMELNDALKLYCRPDIKSKLSQMVETKKVPSYFQEDKLAFMKSQHFEESTEILEEALGGATYVPLEQSLEMHLHEHACSELPYHPSWPLSLISCQPSISDHQYRPPKIPVLKNKNDMRLLWYLLSMATSIPKLWECLVKSVQYEEPLSWHGFLLTYASKNVLTNFKPIRKNTKKEKNPYKTPCKPLELCWKLEGRNMENEDSVNELLYYVPNFDMGKLWACLSSIVGVKVYQSMEDVEHDPIPPGEYTVIALIDKPPEEEFVPQFVVSWKSTTISLITFHCIPH